MQFCNMFTKTPYGMPVYNQEARDAMMKMATTLVQGFEEMGNNYMAATHNSAHANSFVCKEVFDIFMSKDLTNVQAQWTRQTAETIKTETEKFYSSSIKLACQLSESLQTHAWRIWGK